MFKKIFAGLALVVLTAVLFHSVALYRFTQERNAMVTTKAEQTMDSLKGQVDTILRTIVAEADRLADDFGANDYTQEQIEDIIQNSALKIPQLQGVTACFEPYAQSDDRRLYCPYYDKGLGKRIYLEQGYDYTDTETPGTAWYTGVRDAGAKWVEPYFGTNIKDWFIDYGTPFYYSSGPKKGQVRGTITMSFLTSGFKNMVLSLSLGKTGYGIITSANGTFLSHPVNDYVGTASLDSINKVQRQPELKKAFNAIQAGEKGTVFFNQEETGEDALFIYDKIPTSDWGIGLLFYTRELSGDISDLNERYIKLALWISLFLIMIIAVYFNKDHLDAGEIWQLSILATILLILNIVFIWYLQHARMSNEENLNPPVSDMGSLGNFVSQQHQRLEALRLPKSIPIPTGILVQRIAFQNSYNVNISATVWQKYPIDIIDKIQVGFTLPQTSPFAEASYIEEIYRKIIPPQGSTAGYLLIGWEFRVTLQQYLDYQDFPFDKRHISMDIVPISAEDQLVFVPDLQSYEFTNPTKKPGLDKEVKVSGNIVTKSYFSLSRQSYDSDFGFGSKTLFEDVPVLHYNIDLRRILLNVFVTYLIPIFVSLIMMFILLLAANKTKERQGIIEGMAAFFFVLVFSHIDLRKEIITADLIFIEYFYFITYFMIILTTWNLITYAKNKAPIFDYNDNQIFKACFFPFFFLCMLIVTLSEFY
ncbi:hypothetical protein FGM00_09165 [Aggregatimonas sangjinii]|uniref:Cache domain-containing protein n=1 Tax=Aggregatimonas sangjinii TaxID=2583587 RepID=A0A5B7STN0_9FLAO|nr:cache domain-containing protein [Aggregatimonas sangjinii]QCX00271.1 hypothetical protein FGM00_09165 [Aggregatimonas sangjinii]